MKKKGNMQTKEEKSKEDTPIDKEENAEITEQEQTDGTESDKDAIISEQKNRIAELNNKYLYLFAEFENYRKRTSKERLDLIKTASSEVIFSMLPVLDDFERAISACPGDESMKSLKDGLILIYEKYKTVLAKFGLEEIKSQGEVFNTDIHEAVAHVPVESEEQKGKIIDVTEKGYYLNGVVLRYAKVVVAG
ncbi:MAG: nucleotide exchange factor GrpE [Bacteroidales bacterium]|jgi:molecular chaperone GrpE|nr:nucleotide exchange factor GrpE [Bacteroidales bacterium]